MMKRSFYTAVLCFFTFLVCLSRAEPASPVSVNGWKEWIDDKKDYLGKVESLIQESKDAAIQQNMDLEEAIKSKDQAAGESVIAETSKKLSAIVAELKLLNPPEEFREYHDRVIEAYKYRQMANDATLKRERENIRSYSNMSMTYEIEAMEYLRKLYVSRGAPKQLISSIDRGIASYRQRLVAN